MSDARIGALGPPKTGADVLVTAATRWEASPLARGLGLRRTRPDCWDGRVGRKNVRLLKTGMGDRRTRAALEPLAPAEYPLVISAGLCGAMQDGIRTGDIVADAQGVELDLVVPLRETGKTLGLPFHFGKLLHTNVILAPDVKRRLGAEQRALGCDMETAAVRRWAGGGTAVIGVRAVLDELDQAVPADAPEGEGVLALAGYALSRPWRLPGLIKTGVDAATATTALAHFLKSYIEVLP